MNLPRLMRTVAPLRPIQIVGRLAFRFRRPAVDRSPSPRVAATAGWTPPIRRGPVLTGPDGVLVLNQSGPLKTRADWNASGRGKLWLYNLHYFDELSGPADEDRRLWRRALVDRWIEQNPPPTGNGWEPYPTSLRIVNWIKWFLQGEAVQGRWLASLAVQVRWLEKRLEWHLLGNHLLANAKALVFAGAFFEGAEADRWLARGLSILERELDEQILADGGHFELSPMYHSIILEDVLDLVNLAGASRRVSPITRDRWADVAERMLGWLAVMTHPDGTIAFFNDTATGIAPDPAALQSYASRLHLRRRDGTGEGATHLDASGYVRFQRAGATALLDVAEVGPRYLPGHAHADTLSFELSVGGRRIVVNQGVSEYAGPRRAPERSTAAHSTVEIDGRDSSEVWSSFRVGRRARVTDVKVSGGPTLTSSAEHDGYRHLQGSPRHRRTWLMGDRRLQVIDHVNARLPAIARFHLHPATTVELGADALSARIKVGDDVTVEWRSSAPLRLEPFDWACEFGRTVSSQSLVASLKDGALDTVLEW